MPRIRAVLLCLPALLLGLSAAASQPSPVQRTPITHEKLWLMKRVGAPVVSPDGRWAVFSLLEPAYDPDKEITDLWIVATDGGSAPRRLTSTRAPENGVSWSPDSRQIAFSTRREGDEAEQIYLMDLAGGGEAHRVTSLATGAYRPKWRPDGKGLLFESQVYPGAADDEANRKIIAEHKARKYNVRVYEHYPVRFWNQWLDERRPTILTLALADGAQPKDVLSPTELAHTQGFSGVQEESSVSLAPLWSPDGREILFTATTERWNAGAGHVGHRIYRMPAAGGEPQPVTLAAGSYAQAAFAPDGHSLYFTHGIQDEEIYHLDRLERVSWPQAGDPVPVAQDLDREVAGFTFSSDSRTVYLLVPHSGLTSIYQVSATGGKPQPLIEPAAGGYTALVSAPKAAQTVLVGSYGSSVSPAELVRVDVAARRHTNLTRFDTEAAAAIDWEVPEHFYFDSSRGRHIHNLLVKPPAFDPSRKYPLLVLIHGGAASTNPDQIGLRWNYHLLAAPGYVVLMTDYTGSTGQGEKFAQAIKLDPLKTPGDEINEAVDQALKRYPFIDGSRACAAGASYGGHLANWIEATTTRYRCIVSHAGEVDLLTQWGESDGNYEREVTNGGPPWAGSPVWREQSPITYGSQWKTPMLLSIGERDFRVPIGNTLENWATLQRMHVPSKLLVWPDAWHWITKPEDSRHFYEEVHAWLATYLGTSAAAHN